MQSRAPSNSRHHCALAMATGPLVEPPNHSPSDHEWIEQCLLSILCTDHEMILSDWTCLCSCMQAAMPHEVLIRHHEQRQDLRSAPLETGYMLILGSFATMQKGS